MIGFPFLFCTLGAVAKVKMRIIWIFAHCALCIVILGISSSIWFDNIIPVKMKQDVANMGSLRTCMQIRNAGIHSDASSV